MKVSALIVTYNQEKFIEQAIRSALMQQVNFPYEIVIGEDCSTDNTRAIVERIAKENPDKIRAILRDKNLGMHGNHRATHNECRGQYIAMLEGDDYWTDPHKLQKQADFLDAHPECCLCFHNVVIFDEHSEEETLYCRPDIPQITGIEEILQEIYVHTSSILMRNKLFKEFREEGSDLLMGDWTYLIFLATFGKFGYLNEVMGCHRQHNQSAWIKAGVAHRADAVDKMYDIIDDFLQRKYHDQIQVLKARYRTYFDVDGSRRKWKRLAEQRDKRIWDLETSRRNLKLENARLRKMIEELQARLAEQNAAIR